MPAPQGAASGSELTAGGGSLRRSARLQHQPPSQTAQPAKDAGDHANPKSMLTRHCSVARCCLPVTPPPPLRPNSNASFIHDVCLAHRGAASYPLVYLAQLRTRPPASTAFPRGSLAGRQSCSRGRNKAETQQLRRVSRLRRPPLPASASAPPSRLSARPPRPPPARHADPLRLQMGRRLLRLAQRQTQRGGLHSPRPSAGVAPAPAPASRCHACPGRRSRH